MARQPKTAPLQELIPVLPPKPLFERVAGYLDANDWGYDAHPDKGYFAMRISIKDANIKFVLDTFESENWRRLLAYAVLPVFVPEHRRGAVLDAINRINHRLAYGSFEMDPTDGEIRLRTVAEHGKDLNDELIERAFHANLRICEDHFAALMAVCFGNADPATVSEMVERKIEGTLQ